MPTAINTSPTSQQKLPPPVRKAFEEWTLADASAAIQWVIQRRVGKEGFTANWRYAQDHDHLQDGSGWIGPLGADVTLIRSRNMQGVERQFTPVDTIAEVLDNLTNALLQTRSRLTLEPLTPASTENDDARKAQEQEIAGLVALITRWAENRQLWVKARQAVKRARWATWGTLRAWIPESAVTPSIPAGSPDETGVVAPDTSTAPIQMTEEPDHAEQQTTVNLPPGLTLEDALSRVYLSAPDPNMGFVYIDPDTQQAIAIFLYADQRSDFAELCWLDQATGETVFRVVSRGADVDEVRHDLGGKLPVAQMEGELLITEPVRMQQAQLNFANSIMTRVMETAGFPERVRIDALPEAEWTDVLPSTPVLEIKVDASGKTWYLVPSEGPTLGGGLVQDVQSKADDGPNGTTVPRQASVQKFEPTDPAYVIKAKADARATILRQCKQGHVDMDDNGQPSGFSRVQARASHLADVTNMQGPLQRMLQDALEVALRFAALMSDEAAGVLAKYRVTVTVNVDLGPVDPQERTAILDMLKAGALSLPTALALLQVDDVAAEIERIRSQPESQLATFKAKADILAILISSCQFDQVLAAELVGLEPEQVALIKKAQAMDQPPPVDPNAPPTNGGPPNRLGAPAAA